MEAQVCRPEVNCRGAPTSTVEVPQPHREILQFSAPSKGPCLSLPLRRSAERGLFRKGVAHFTLGTRRTRKPNNHEGEDLKTTPTENSSISRNHENHEMIFLKQPLIKTTPFRCSDYSWNRHSKVPEGHHPRGTTPRVLRGLCGGLRGSAGFSEGSGGSDPMLVTLGNFWKTQGFSRRGRFPKESFSETLQGQLIPSGRCFCPLGVVILRF